MSDDWRFDAEWWSPGVLKPSRAMEYSETKAWRAARIAAGARVLTPEEWEQIHSPGRRSGLDPVRPAKHPPPPTYVLTSRSDRKVMAWTSDYDFATTCAETFNLDVTEATR